MADDASVTDWLLDSDPSIRWQVMRDLLDAPEPRWRAERAKVETEGWGARLLSCEDEDGQWAGGAFIPRDFDAREWHEVGQPWTATMHSLSLLREFGLDPSSDRARRAVAADRRELALGTGRRALLGGRGRGVHQRPDRGRRCLLRGRRLAPRRAAPRRASRRRRLELRASQRLGPLVLRHHYQRARRAPGVRTGHRWHARFPGGAQVRRGVSPGARPLPPPQHRRARRRAVPALRASEPVALRRPAGPGLLPLAAPDGATRTRGSATPSTTSGPGAWKTAPGRWTGACPAGSGSRSTTAPASPPAGSPCGRCACSSGGTPSGMAQS